MEGYARLLLAFLHAATSTQRHAGLRRQVFSFGTELRNLGPAFAQADADAMLERANAAIADFGGGTRLRSEEHTSELQSQSNLVCRLLLEKKKKNPHTSSAGDSPNGHVTRSSMARSAATGSRRKLPRTNSSWLRQPSTKLASMTVVDAPPS